MVMADRPLDEQANGTFPLGSLFSQHDKTKELNRFIKRYIAMGLNNTVIWNIFVDSGYNFIEYNSETKEWERVNRNKEYYSLVDRISALRPENTSQLSPPKYCHCVCGTQHQQRPVYTLPSLKNLTQYNDNRVLRTPNTNTTKEVKNTSTVRNVSGSGVHWTQTSLVDNGATRRDIKTNSNQNGFDMLYTTLNQLCSNDSCAEKESTKPPSTYLSPDDRSRKAGIRCKHCRKAFVTKPHKKKCSHEDCSNQAIKSRLCRKHYREAFGTAVLICSHEGCTRAVQKSALCARHYREIFGVSFNTCSQEDCIRQTQKSGFCRRHYKEMFGKATLTCSREECPRGAVKATLCCRHYREAFGTSAYTCSREECSTQVWKSGLCRRHYRETFGTATHTCSAAAHASRNWCDTTEKFETGE